MKLVLAEKPSVAQSIAKVLGANKREDGYLEGGGYVVSWCVGHLVELAEPESYDEKYGKWSYNDLPIFPTAWKYNVSSGTKKQFGILKKLMERNDIDSLVCATNAGREGETNTAWSIIKPVVKSHLRDCGFPLWKMLQSKKDLKISGPELNTMLCMKQPCVESEPTGLLVSTLLDFFLPFMGRL